MVLQSHYRAPLTYTEEGCWRPTAGWTACGPRLRRCPFLQQMGQRSHGKPSGNRVDRQGPFRSGHGRRL